MSVVKLLRSGSGMIFGVGLFVMMRGHVVRGLIEIAFGILCVVLSRVEYREVKSKDVQRTLVRGIKKMGYVSMYDVATGHLKSPIRVNIRSFYNYLLADDSSAGAPVCCPNPFFNGLKRETVKETFEIELMLKMQMERKNTPEFRDLKDLYEDCFCLNRDILRLADLRLKNKTVASHKEFLSLLLADSLFLDFPFLENPRPFVNERYAACDDLYLMGLLRNYLWLLDSYLGCFVWHCHLVDAVQKIFDDMDPDHKVFRSRKLWQSFLAMPEGDLAMSFDVKKLPAPFNIEDVRDLRAQTLRKCREIVQTGIDAAVERYPFDSEMAVARLNFLYIKFFSVYQRVFCPFAEQDIDHVFSTSLFDKLAADRKPRLEQPKKGLPAPYKSLLMDFIFAAHDAVNPEKHWATWNLNNALCTELYTDVSVLIERPPEDSPEAEKIFRRLLAKDASALSALDGRFAANAQKAAEMVAKFDAAFGALKGAHTFFVNKYVTGDAAVAADEEGPVRRRK